jgi:hypothetical protein
MTWRERLDSMSFILGLVSLGLAVVMGMHLEHLINGGDDSGGRHLGEVLLISVLGLLAFAGSRYGVRQSTES